MRRGGPGKRTLFEAQICVVRGSSWPSQRAIMAVSTPWRSGFIAQV